MNNQYESTHRTYFTLAAFRRELDAVVNVIYKVVLCLEGLWIFFTHNTGALKRSPSHFIMVNY